MKTLLSLLACLLALVAGAQEPAGAVAGRILLAGGEPAARASVALYSGRDSALVKTALSATDGGFRLAPLATGSYYLVVSFSGHSPYKSASLDVSGPLTVPDIRLEKSGQSLQGVTVTARKPVIEQKFDKLVFNVSGNVSAAGNSALDVLAKAPTVMVDANGSVSMGGRSGVLILIDGKPTHLSEADLAAYLRGLPASSIERIDLISNPSAQYEAAGTSGIIDIRLKKDNRQGYNGSLSAAYLVGTHSSGNGSLTFNYRKRSLNIFGNLSKSYDHVTARQETERLYFNSNNAPTGSLSTANDRDFVIESNNARLGADYYAGRKTVLGLVLGGSINHVAADYRTRTTNVYGTDSTDFALDRSRNGNGRNNGSINVNVKHSIDTGGHEWNFDFDHAQYRNQDDIDISANYFDKGGLPNRPYYALLGDLSGKLQVYAARLDYQRPRVGGGTLQAGLRSSLVDANNNLLFYDASSGTPLFDGSKSNHFLYRENINAGYLNYQRRRGPWSLQLGLRLENTEGKGTQLATGSSFRRSYTQLFPSLVGAYELSANYSLSLSLSRRIDRPSYSQLNPFRFYGSPFGYTEGNPDLRPQLSYLAELSQTFYKRYIVRLSYSLTNDVTGLVWGLDPQNNRISAQRPVNLDRLQMYRMTVTAPITKGRWSSFNNLIGAYSRYQGAAFGTELNRGLPSVSLSSNNTIRVSAATTIELNGWVRTAALQGGYQRLDPAGSLTVGVGRRILKGAGNLRFNVSDVFRTNLGFGSTTLNNYVLHVRQWNETRRATLSFTWNFGRQTVTAARTRSTGSEEETRRAN